MKTFKATVREDFGEYIRGQKITLTQFEENPSYFWISHPVTGKPTRDLVDDSLLSELEEIDRAA